MKFKIALIVVNFLMPVALALIILLACLSGCQTWDASRNWSAGFATGLIQPPQDAAAGPWIESAVCPPERTGTAIIGYWSELGYVVVRWDAGWADIVWTHRTIQRDPEWHAQFKEVKE
jgi:hypothetical protein